MTDTTDAPPFIPVSLLPISSPPLTSSQHAPQPKDLRSCRRYVSTVPGLVFKRLVANLNRAFNAALGLERQQHASDFNMSQPSNDDEEPTPAPGLAVRTRPNPRIGTFHTNEICSCHQMPAQTSKTISFGCPYPSPPGIPVGLTELNIGSNANLHISSYTSSVNTDQFEVHIDSWEDMGLCSARCSWLEIEADDPDFQFGSYNTLDDQSWDKCPCQPLITQEIMFQRAYDVPPVVVVWLSGFNMNQEYNCRIKTFAEGVTATGFTINIVTSGDSVLYSAVSSWVSYTAGIPGVCSGRFGTLDLRPSHFPQSYNRGYVGFGEKAFSAAPRTMLVINSVDVDGGRGLKLSAKVSSISVEGMQWHLDGSTSMKVYSAGGSYVAFS